MRPGAEFRRAVLGLERLRDLLVPLQHVSLPVLLRALRRAPVPERHHSTAGLVIAPFHQATPGSTASLAARRYRADHPVIACTIVADQVAMVCIGDPADTAPDDRDVFPLSSDDITIAELIRAVLATAHKFAVEFAPDRVLIASA